MNKLQKRLQSQRGFTLIELLVVIVIIGILIALLLPNLFSSQQRARDTERKADVDAIQGALETYYSDNNAYPAEPTDLVPDYTQAVPEDPQDGVYDYIAVNDAGTTCTTAADDCQSYTLSATLENQEDPSAADTAVAAQEIEVGDYVVESINQP